MRSFAIWYDAKDENHNNDVKAKIHINFWNSLEYLEKEKCCFFDFGFLINDISNIKNINLYCPFFIKKNSRNRNNVYDLGAKISNIELVDAIFNENYIATTGEPKRFIIDTEPNSNTAQNTEESQRSNTAQNVDMNNESFYNDLDFKKFIIYSLDDNNEIDIQYCKKKPVQGDNCCTKIDDGTIVRLKIGDIYDHSSSNIKKIKAYYFRIRVRVNESQLYTITQKVDYKFFLRDSFYKTIVMDFRLNDIRSFNPAIKDCYAYGKKFKIKSVNYLIMRNITDEVDALGMRMNCRLLEYDLWNKYIDDLQNNMMAYHIKEKAVGEEFIKDFCAVVKIKYEMSTYITLVIYLIVLIGMGVIGNFAYDCLLGKLCN